MDFVDQARFVEVMTQLPHQPGKSAADVCVDRGDLQAVQVAALSSLMEVQIAANGGDVGKSIALLERDPYVGQTVLLAGGRQGRER